jgi:hypothetical protein
MQKQKTQLMRLIQQEVRRQMKQQVMAKTREDFINSLSDACSPALEHYYRYTLGKLNNRHDQVEKWQQHEEQFLSQFQTELLKATKAKRLDRRKAVETALEEIIENDAARRRGVTAKFQTTYKLDKLVPLPEDAHEAFVARVWEIVDTMFPE